MTQEVGCNDSVTITNDPIGIKGADGINIASPANPLNVDATFTGTLEVNLDHADDSVSIWGTDGAVDRKIKTDSDGELQVDVLTLPAITGTVELGATTLAALENTSVTVTSSVLPTGAATSANQLPDNHQVTVSNFPVTQVVSATNLDIRDLVFATDKVDVTGSSVSVSNFPATQPVSGTVDLGATTLAALETISVGNTVTVAATDLDIRNLSSAQDSVTVTGTVNAVLSEPISVDDNGGSLTVDGSKPPSDAYANPTDHVGTWSLNGVWDATNSLWRRLKSIDSKGILRAQLDGGPLAYTDAIVSATTSDSQLIASGSGAQGREVVIWVPVNLTLTSVQTYGVHIKIGGSAATTSGQYVPVGSVMRFNTQQEVRVIRETAATANVSVYTRVGTPVA